MKLMTKYACLALLSCSCSLLAGTLVDLGPLVKPVELLDDGSVVALDMNDKVPFKWSNGQRVDMPDLVNTGSGLPVMAKDATPVERSVKAANGNLQVGWVNDVNMEVQPGPTKRAAVWRGTSVSLLSDAGFGGCANGVSPTGVVVGYVQLERHRGQAAAWTNGSLNMLPDVGAGYSEAFAVNADGVIAGHALVANKGYRAVIWREGQMVELDTLCSLPEGWVLSEASCINSAGDVAGSAVVNGQLRGFLLTK